MRVIKFRGQTADKDGWVFGCLIKVKGKFFIYNGDYDNDKKIYLNKNGFDKNYIQLDNFRCYGVIPETIGQFTNVLDKNKKEIYENQYILYKGEKRIIGYRDGSFILLKHSIEVEGSLINGSCWEGTELITCFDSDLEIVEE